MIEVIESSESSIDGLGILCSPYITKNKSVFFSIFQFNNRVGTLLVKLDSDFNIETYDMLYRDELNGFIESKTELDNEVGIVQLDRFLKEFIEENKLIILLNIK